jgi:hypothetical protein
MTFSLESAEPVLLSALASPAGSLAVGSDPRLALYRGSEGADQWSLLAENDSWRDADTASITEVLRLRQTEDAIPEQAAALPLTLATGTYKITLTNTGESGLVTLSLETTPIALD